MIPFQHVQTIPEQAISSDGIATFSMGVNPLSMMMLVIKPLNDTGTLANYASYFELCDALNSVTLLRNGYPIIRASGKDLALMNYQRRGVVPFMAGDFNVNNDRRCAVLPLYFGKMPVDPTECLPRSTKGQLELQVDFDIADTGYDGLRFAVESFELPDANPKTFERMIVRNQTFAATGKQSFYIPPGNKFRGFQLFGTTGFAGASPAPTWGTLEIRVDNQPIGIYSSAWEVHQAMQMLLKSRALYGYDAHKHGTTVDGNAQTYVPTLGSPYEVSAVTNNYAYIDFDVNGDDWGILDTKGKVTLEFVPSVGTADAARVLPVEVIDVSEMGSKV